MPNRTEHNWYLREEFHPFVKLAYSSMYSYLERERRLDLQKMPPELAVALKSVLKDLTQRASCFVSLKIAGQLRGCIGTIEPLASNLAEEIVENAVSAATRDPRFPPVDQSELPKLKVSVDVLSTPKLATDEELDPKKYGLIVEQMHRRGLLLPDLEGVKDAETQKRIAAQKGGIDLNRPHKLYTFTVQRYV
jgi:AmmeMemoRadiSam system protein A